MFNRKEIKKKARKNLKKHYWLFVVACLIAIGVGCNNSSVLSNLSGYNIYNKTEEIVNKSPEYFSNSQNLFKEVVDNSTIIPEDKKIGIIDIGRTNGVLADIANKFSSGQMYTIILGIIKNLFNKYSNLVVYILILIVGLLFLFIISALKNTYEVSYSRVFLEGRTYEKIRYDDFLYLFRNKKIVKVNITMFIMSMFKFLWDLTIIGGFIVSYSYSMVPFILAENPDISPLKAIKLSKKMMRGHKFEFFKVDLSMFGWSVLSTLTSGLSDIMFSSPYHMAINCEYYSYIRSLAIENKIEGYEYLNDTFLFKKPDYELVEDNYQDIIEILTDDIELEDYKQSGFRGFIENNFGLIYKYDEKEDKFNEAIEQEEKIKQYKDVLELKQYPNRLNPLYLNSESKRLATVHYLRHYSFRSIVSMFFIFCMIGYAWEVMLHVITDGTLVNRGVLHGPWLPIYGVGGVLILIVLYRFRDKPWLEALSTIVLCGSVEYFTAWYLETYKGLKWWDYTGYFINIKGRICLEGLLVFMIGGLAVVYIVAPLLDNYIRKIKRQILLPILLVLVITFFGDVIYSKFYPNTGEGVTINEAYVYEGEMLCWR